MAQVLSFQELIKFTAVMRFTCQSWGILHSEKRGELADQARGFSRVAAAPYPGYLLCRFFAGWRLCLTRPTHYIIVRL
ncbi:hypothetical protein KP13_32001 [Klebsiella pneumoniae subsp. pneumoniae Kp13]|nr:hypothetical protein KP13_32001 [Klebsiella pneumoniae subsp. pneumoniae Kp13]